MNSSALGSFAFVLHGHLPYVLARGRWPHGIDWLCEATAETYLPLLNICNRLVSEGCSPKVTMGVTPVLTEQLADPSFADEFAAYIQQKIQTARDNRSEFTQQQRRHFVTLAERWEDRYRSTLSNYRVKYRGNLVGALRALQEAGHIEIITCAATHGYLPLLAQDTSVQAQIKIGVDTHRRHYGRAPRGIWLPECAYRPRYEWSPPREVMGVSRPPYLRKGVDEFLSENDLDYFIIDSHLLKGGRAIGVYLDRFQALQTLWKQFQTQYQPLPEEAQRTPYQPYLVSSAPEGRRPVAVFTRHEETALQVWRGDGGYPGDGWYLDFHKRHFPGGHRYWRVTHAQADLADKQPYEPDKVAGRIAENAQHFVWLVKKCLREHHEATGGHGIICAPCGAELFGHWWFEGPEWLYQVLKKLSQDEEIDLVTCAEFLDARPPSTVISLPEGSWGEGGFHWIWLNDWTRWTWRHIYGAEERFYHLAHEHADTNDGQLRSILEQAARELLLLQSSDWQFLISTWSARDYAELRCAEHAEAFRRLADMAERRARGVAIAPEDSAFLNYCQQRDKVFSGFDLNWFAHLEHPPTP